MIRNTKYQANWSLITGPASLFCIIFRGLWSSDKLPEQRFSDCISKMHRERCILMSILILGPCQNICSRWLPLGFIRKSCESLENCGGVKNMKFASESWGEEGSQASQTDRTGPGNSTQQEKTRCATTAVKYESYTQRCALHIKHLFSRIIKRKVLKRCYKWMNFCE